MGSLSTPSAAPLLDAEVGPSPSVKPASRAYVSRFHAGLDALRLDGTLCDLTVVAGGIAMRVHRVVMAAASDVFRVMAVMLTVDMREKDAERVELEDMTASGLLAAVEFVYRGQLQLSLDNVQDVL